MGSSPDIGSLKGLQNQFWIEDRILRFRIASPVDDEEALRLDVGGRALLDAGLADDVIIELAISADFSPSVRERWARFLQHERIRKVSIYGLSFVVGVVAAMVIGISGRAERIRVFKEEDEAKAWVADGRAPTR